jgi:NADPH-dependent curcumin reductase CurA
MPQTLSENRRWVLARRPRRDPVAEDFRFERVPVPAPGHGQVLLQTQYLSLDPYMRGRMSDAPSYAPPVPVDGVMVGETVSKVVRSNHPAFAPGDLVTKRVGWQDYAVSDGSDLLRVPEGVRPSLALGALGMTGMTAWYGLTQIGKPRAGETVVVAAATGAVGSMVGQLAKQRGCRAVGIAGGQQKCAFAVDGLGFDACIDHRGEDFPQALAAACPDGIDIYFENVGGPVLKAVLPLLNERARIPLCGLIALYSDGPREDRDRSGAMMRTFLVRKVTVQGFIVTDHYDLFDQFLAEALPLVRSGALRYREDVVDGLEAAPEAFIGLLKGRNFGKLVVRVGDVE